MPDEPSQTDVSPEPTDVRFSIRGLMMFTAGVALASAALGPYFRGLEPDQRVPVAALWAVCGAFVLAWLAYHGRTRYRLEQEAGRRILAFAPRGRWIRNRRPWITVLYGWLAIAFGLTYLVMNTEKVYRATNATVLFAIVFPGLFSAIFIALGIATMWWNRHVQLREHGVLHGLRLLKWTHVTEHRWTSGGLALDGVDQLHNDARIEMVVPSTGKPAVESLLAAKLRERIHYAAREASATAANIVALPPIRISPRQNVTWRRLMKVLAIYIAIGCVLSFRPWGATPFEFNIAFGAGFFLWIAATAWSGRHARTSGPPLVRLRVAADVPRTLASCLLAIGAYYVNQHMPFSHPILSVGLGSVSGFCIAAIAMMIFHDQVDLCENGTILGRRNFWPWEAVRVSKWNHYTNGRLVLRRGWRRVIAKVPLDERLAVDAVLKDKLPADRVLGR